MLVDDNDINNQTWRCTYTHILANGETRCRKVKWYLIGTQHRYRTMPMYPYSHPPSPLSLSRCCRAKNGKKEHKRQPGSHTHQRASTNNHQSKQQ